MRLLAAVFSITSSSWLVPAGLAAQEKNHYPILQAQKERMTVDEDALARKLFPDQEDVPLTPVPPPS